MPSRRALAAFCSAVVIAVTVVTLAVLALGSGTASAHNSLVSSAPADGAQLTENPTQISFSFDLPAPLETASAELIDATGVRTDLTGLAHGPAGEAEIVAPLPPDLSGAVTVRWRLVSPDGHAITGRVSFTIATPTTSPAAVTTVPSIGEPNSTATAAVVDGSDESSGTPGVARWLLRFGSYVAIAAVIGITLTDRLVWPGVASQPLFRRAISWSLATVAALAVVQLLVLAADIEGSSPWSSFDALEVATLTDAGIALAIRIVVSAVAWILLCRMYVVDDQIRWTAITITGVALMGSWAWAGHAKSQRWSWVGVPVDVVHHTAAALWIGALASVGTSALAVLREGELASVMRRMSTVAAAAVAVIVATGAIQTVRLVGGPAQLFDTTHGRSLVAKLVLVAVMLVLANHHRMRVAAALRTEQKSALAASHLRRTVMAELALGLAVVGITAAMVVAPPSSADTGRRDPSSSDSSSSARGR